MAIELTEPQARTIINHSLMFCIDVDRSLKFFHPLSHSNIFASTETMEELSKTTVFSLDEIKISFQKRIH